MFKTIILITSICMSAISASASEYPLIHCEVINQAGEVQQVLKTFVTTNRCCVEIKVGETGQLDFQYPTSSGRMLVRLLENPHYPFQSIFQKVYKSVYMSAGDDGLISGVMALDEVLPNHSLRCWQTPGTQD